MRATVTNLSASASVDLPPPFSVTLAPSGSKTLGITVQDFLQKDETGNPLWKRWDALLRSGAISVTPLGDASNQLSILLILQSNIVADDLTVTGDIAAAGGFRQTIGPFTAPGAAGAVAAGQTDLDMRYSHTVTAAALGFVAKRAGSIMGLSAQLSAALTGAGQSVQVKVTVNGVEVGAALDLDFTQAGAETEAFSTAAKGAVTFAAGDIIGVSYTSDTITNTPALVASVEIEC